jgi:hypothetical protein
MTFNDITIGLKLKIGEAFHRVHSKDGNIFIMVAPSGSVQKLGDKMVDLFCVQITEADYSRLFAEEENVRENGHEPYVISVDNSKKGSQASLT